MQDEQREDALQIELVGGRPCLDFANHRERMLGDADPYGRLIELSLAMHLLELPEANALLLRAEKRHDGRHAVVRRVDELGAALTSLFTAVAHVADVSVAALSVLNRETANAYANAEISPRGPGLEWRWRASSPPAPDRPLWPVARDAADLLTARDPQRIKLCASEPCRWLFLDESKNGRRRWCDMAVCGNRAKARRYRERQRVATEAYS